MRIVHACGTLRPIRRLLLFATTITCSVLCLFHSAKGQDTSLDLQAQHYAEEFGRKAFTRCSATNSYVMGPFPRHAGFCEFDKDKALISESERGHGSCEKIVEITKVLSTKPFHALRDPDPTDPKIWGGVIQFDYSLSRTRYRYNGSWLPWNSPTVHVPPVPVAGLENDYGFWTVRDMRGLGQIGSTPGQGYVSTDVGTIWENITDNLKELSDFEYSMPKIIPIKEFLDSVSSLSCDDLIASNKADRMAEKPVPTPAPVPRRPMPNIPRETRKDVQFTGNSEDFAAALPALLQKASVADGLDPKNYQEESAFIINLVRTCAQITPDRARSVTKFIGDPKNDVGTENLGALGPQYNACYLSLVSASKQSKASHKPPEKELLYHLTPSGQNYRHGNGFKIDVRFYSPGQPPSPSDDVVLAAIE